MEEISFASPENPEELVLDPNDRILMNNFRR